MNYTDDMDGGGGGGEICCSKTASSEAFESAFAFWVEGVLAFAAGIFGLAGNLLSISVLRT